ncbi:MAG: hypothetical protein U1F11_15595 [Steroidobacteraceae bacterium]
MQIIGFAKQIGDIADGARSVIEFFTLAFVLALSVWLYCRSVRSPRSRCSPRWCRWSGSSARCGCLATGSIRLQLLVPFLVFAIGVSHGVQQINFVVKGVCAGANSMTAARRRVQRAAGAGIDGAGDGVRRLRHARR